MVAEACDAVLGRGPLVNGAITVVQHFPDVPRSKAAFGWIEQAAKVGHMDVARADGSDALQRYVPADTVY